MSSDNRNQFIDALRAFAVLAMIVYHFAWDLGLFNVVDPITVNSGRWKLFAVSIGSSFLFLSGISFWLASRNGINFKKFTFRLLFLILNSVVAVTDTKRRWRTKKLSCSYPVALVLHKLKTYW